MKKIVLLLACLGLTFVGTLQAQHTVKMNEKRIFFPYFRLNDAPKILMPLMPQKTEVSAKIDGIRALVQVKQTYKNTQNTRLSLACVVPTDLDKLTVAVGNQVILTKPEAKIIYPEAQQPLFMPDIEAGKTLELAWEYHVICEKDVAGSVFRFPAFQPSIEGANLDYDLKILFHTDLPIQEITSEEHLIDVHHATSNTAEVVFASEEQKEGERPFVLRFKHHSADTKITTPQEGVLRGDMPKDEYNTGVVGKDEDKISENIYIITKLYEVKEGDYPEKIAHKFNIKPEEIKHKHLKKGQQITLKVPCLRITHTVAEDEYPYSIAKMYGVDVWEVLEWNKLKDTDMLSIGQEIFIYKPKK